MSLRRVGFFPEAICDEEGFKILQSQISTEEDENKENILQYLNEGHFLVASPTVIKDIFDQTNAIIGSACIYTDGIWMWPKEFAFYIGRYNIKVPLEFFKHMEENKWRVPKDININAFIP